MKLPASSGTGQPADQFSLTLRLMVWVLAVLVALWLAAGATVWWEVRHEITELVEQLPIQGDAAQIEHDRREILSAIVEGLLGALLVMLPLMGALLIVVIYYSLAPLRRMGRALAQRQANDLQALPDAGIPKELRPVWNEINALLERIAKGVELEKRFTADAAHELRTPVAAMRAQAQVARMSEASADRDHALSQVMQACDRAGRLIDQLLALSRLEGQGPPGVVVQTDLVPLVRELMADMASNNLYEWCLDGDEHALVRVDANLCRIVLRNLFDNATRYSPTGSTISVHISRQGAITRLVVADSGPGMSPEERVRLGERFYRANPNGATGSGLGWSIVQRIAENQRFTVSVAQSQRWGGLEVQLVFSDPVAAV